MSKVIVQFQGQEYSVELKDGLNVIGRSSRCSIPIRDLNTSREHCEIQAANGSFVLLDKGSMNGTRLNGKKVAASRLSPGDAIVIGQTTIWFESKPAGAPEAVAVSPPSVGSEADPVTARRERETGTEPAKAASDAKPRKRPSVSAPVKDYAVAAPARAGSGRKIGSIAAIVAVLVLGILFVRSLSGGGTLDDADETNLVRGNFSFELPSAEGARGWALAGPSSSRVATDATAAHHGRHSLLIDKSPAAGDLMIEVVARDAFPLRGIGRVEASAFVKADGFGGACHLKINWLAAAGGPVLLEQTSAPVSKPGSWQPLKAEFDVPAGAGAFTLGLAAVGRGGRIWFDEVRLHVREGTPARPSVIGPVSLAIASNGVMDLAVASTRLLGNVSIVLEAEKEGRITQAVAENAKVEASDKRVHVTGRMPSPADLKPVDFEIEMLPGAAGELLVGARVWGENLKLVDRMRWEMTLPRDARVSGLATATGPGTPRVTVVSEEAGLALEYRDLVRAEVEGTRPRRLVHVIPVDPSSGRAAISLQLRSGAGALGAGADPLKEAKRVEAERDRPGEARRLLFDSLRSLREPELREQIGRELRRLDDLEQSDWGDLQARYFLAWISRRVDLHSSVLDDMARYQRRWDGDLYQAKAAELRGEIQKSHEESQTAGGEERASRVMGEAKACLEKGRRAMAGTLCELVMNRYPATKAAADAQELLKSLQASKD